MKDPLRQTARNMEGRTRLLSSVMRIGKKKLLPIIPQLLTPTWWRLILVSYVFSF
jgi:hypothetical protein